MLIPKNSKGFLFKTMISDARLPKISDPKLKDAMKQLRCEFVEVVDIEPRPNTAINECHTNVSRQVAMYGGEQIQGYYIAVSKSTNDWVAIKHSVWKRDQRLIDITPVDDNRTCNVFIYGCLDKLHTSVYYHNNKLIIDDTVIFRKKEI